MGNRKTINSFRIQTNGWHQTIPQTKSLNYNQFLSIFKLKARAIHDFK